MKRSTKFQSDEVVPLEAEAREAKEKRKRPIQWNERADEGYTYIRKPAAHP